MLQSTVYQLACNVCELQDKNTHDLTGKCIENEQL